MDPLVILDASREAVVIAKPPGLPSTGPRPESPGSAEYALRMQLGRPVWAVHQLDKDTSGANLFALKKAAVAPLAAALKAGQKTYLALCHGAPPPAFTVDDPIGIWREPGSPRTFPAVARLRTPVSELREARTHFQTLATTTSGTIVAPRDRVRSPTTAPAVSLVRCQPETGRTHQIRLHLAAEGFPLLGERLHAPPHLPPDPFPRHMLHAASLALPAFTVVAPCPPDLLAVIDRLGDPRMAAALTGLLQHVVP
jgi:23S rRNA-/tRNA-specific pseudouridylate synthase